MSKVFRSAPVDGYEWVVASDEDDFEAFHALGGRGATDWKPIEVERLVDDGEARLREADFPWLGVHALIVRERARQVVEAIAGSEVELLPLRCDDAKLWVLNPLVVIDALDLVASDLVHFSTGRIMDIRRHVFVEERVAGVSMFKVPSLMRGPTYLGEHFVDAVRSAGLKGIDFDLVWDGT